MYLYGPDPIRKVVIHFGESKYNNVAKNGYEAYLVNPNGSEISMAMRVSDDGRHLVMVPHIEDQHSNRTGLNILIEEKMN